MMKKSDIEDLETARKRVQLILDLFMQRIPKYREYIIADHIAYAITYIEESLPINKKKKK